MSDQHLSSPAGQLELNGSMAWRSLAKAQASTRGSEAVALSLGMCLRRRAAWKRVRHVGWKPSWGLKK